MWWSSLDMFWFPRPYPQGFWTRTGDIQDWLHVPWIHPVNGFSGNTVCYQRSICSQNVLLSTEPLFRNIFLFINLGQVRLGNTRPCSNVLVSLASFRTLKWLGIRKKYKFIGEGFSAWQGEYRKAIFIIPFGKINSLFKKLYEFFIKGGGGFNATIS